MTDDDVAASLPPEQELPEQELRTLLRATRAWVAWLKDSGVEALPGDPTAAARRAAAASAPSPSPAAAVVAHALAPPPEPEDAETAAKDAALREQLATASGAAFLVAGDASGGPALAARGGHDPALVVVSTEEEARGNGDPNALFATPAGLLRDKMVTAMGLDDGEVLHLLILVADGEAASSSSSSSSSEPGPAARSLVAEGLRRCLRVSRPSVVVALGAVALEALQPGDPRPDIKRVQGAWKLYRGRLPMMPTLSPQHLLTVPEDKRGVWNDLKAVLHRLGRKPPGRRPAKRRAEG
ncbi:MAG: hypothetical protein AAGN82_00635 [Myxococcota bacterium]